MIRDGDVVWGLHGIIHARSRSLHVFGWLRARHASLQCGKRSNTRAIVGWRLDTAPDGMRYGNATGHDGPRLDIFGNAGLCDDRGVIADVHMVDHADLTRQRHMRA